jgi:amino acid adenylation domain-containing protein
MLPKSTRFTQGRPLTESRDRNPDAPGAAPQENPIGKSVPQLVEARAVAAPNAVAVVAGNQRLTYKELDGRANQVARHLRALGVGPETVVGLCFKRSIAMIMGALGILKAGGAYLPLDPASPEARLKFTLNDAQAPVVVAAVCAEEKLLGGNWHSIILSPEGRFPSSQTSEPLAVGIRPTNLAYVIYTSGSTGKPKGVEITHSSLRNLILWHWRAFEVTAADRASQVAGVAFDASVWEVWPYLTAGASLHIPDENIVSDAELLRDWFAAQGITICFVPTPMAELLISLDWPANPCLRVMLTGGDTLHHYPPPSLPFKLVNNYGPTECTVVATSGTISPDKKPGQLPSIGRSISNVEIRILDGQLNQAPIGTAGELHIGGAGLGRGYRNRPDLTAERFIPNPFSSEPGARLYKTGDLACCLPNGQIAFLGRIDDQIKIRGFRIEPNEVVAALNEHPAISQSAVMAREDASGDRRLVGYVVPTPNAQPTRSALRNFLKARLPEYMIPNAFVPLQALPLNLNGKTDRAALPPPTAANTLRDDTFVAPQTAVEERIASILAGLLNLDQVSVEDNFFLLGGHSLLGTQLIARVRDAFGVDLSLRSLFDSPTVAKLSAEVERLLLAKLEAMSEEEARRILETMTSSGAGGGLA